MRVRFDTLHKGPEGITNGTLWLLYEEVCTLLNCGCLQKLERAVLLQSLLWSMYENSISRHHVTLDSIWCY